MSDQLPREYYLGKLASFGVVSLTDFRELSDETLRTMVETLRAAIDAYERNPPPLKPDFDA